MSVVRFGATPRALRPEVDADAGMAFAILAGGLVGQQSLNVATAAEGLMAALLGPLLLAP